MILSTSEGSKKSVRSGLFEDIENFVTSGYGKKEDLRAFDKNLREKYYAELMDLRHKWEKIYLEVLESGQTIIGKECKVAIQTIDRLASVVNRAEYGYAGLFDRVNKIREQSLGSILEYDKDLVQHLSKLNQDVTEAEAALRAAVWPVFKTTVVTLNQDLQLFEEKWNRRKAIISEHA
jgi:hypothetical protein